MEPFATHGPRPRLFLLRPGALGDTLLCAPALAALKARAPSAWVALAGHWGAARLLADAGLTDLPLSGDDPRLSALFGTSGRLAEARAVLMPLTGAVAWLRDPEGLVAANLQALGAQNVVVAPSQPAPASGVHVAAHLLETLAELAGPLVAPRGPLLVAPAAETRWAEGFLRSATGARDRPYVALHPGSGSERKNWPADGFAAVADGLAGRAKVVLLGGPADEAAVAAVRVRVHSDVVIAAGLPLPRVAGLLTRCAVYVGNDSGISHLSALLGVPTVALFGPTDPVLWRPWGDRATVLTWTDGLDPTTVMRALEAYL